MSTLMPLLLCCFNVFIDNSFWMQLIFKLFSFFLSVLFNFCHILWWIKFYVIATQWTGHWGFTGLNPHFRLPVTVVICAEPSWKIFLYSRFFSPFSAYECLWKCHVECSRTQGLMGTWEMSKTFQCGKGWTHSLPQNCHSAATVAPPLNLLLYTIDWQYPLPSVGQLGKLPVTTRRSPMSARQTRRYKPWRRQLLVLDAARALKPINS